MLVLNDLLRHVGIDPRDVNVILHSPCEQGRGGDLKTIMPTLPRTRPRAVMVYNAILGGGATRALAQGRAYAAAFTQADDSMNGGRRRMLFLGLYRNPGKRMRPHAEVMADLDVAWLNREFGYLGDPASHPADHAWPWFDLEPDNRLSDMPGRLVVAARLTPSYVRKAENLDASVAAILETSTFDAPPPDWREMAATAAFVRVMPPGWASKLAEWRGVYLITDEADGARHVGSACGAENMLGRWRAHVAGPRGITAELRRRETSRFRFSILEPMSPAATAEEVIAREQTWMERLHTRRFGLNAGGPSRAGENDAQAPA